MHVDTNIVVTCCQVDARAASLNSNDVFIVDYDKKVYVWVGKVTTSHTYRVTHCIEF